MVLKNSLASDFMISATRGLPEAFAPEVGALESFESHPQIQRHIAIAPIAAKTNRFILKPPHRRSGKCSLLSRRMLTPGGCGRQSRVKMRHAIGCSKPPFH